MNLAENTTTSDNYIHAISHDLREPARMVSQFLKLIKLKTQDQMTSDTEEYLGFAIEASEKMDRMIKGLSELNKLNEYSEELSEFNFSEVIEKIKVRRQDLISQKRAQITWSGSNLIKSRREALELVLTEVILNSLQHSKPKSDLTIHITVKSDQNNGLLIEVKDNGTGLAEFWRVKSFEPFKKKNKNSGNLGLGLTRAKTIVNRFNGKINMKRTDCSGICVSFSIN